MPENEISHKDTKSTKAQLEMIFKTGTKTKNHFFHSFVPKGGDVTGRVPPFIEKLQKLRLMPAKSSQGFTLIEMVVVLSILGLLVSMVSFQNTKMVDRSKDAALMKALNQIRTAVHQFLLDNDNSFPVSLNDLHEYIGPISEFWKGAKGTGKYYFNDKTGQVFLFDEMGENPSNVLDSRGQTYGEY